MHPASTWHVHVVQRFAMANTFGISLGASVAVTTDSTGEIFRNELGGHTTASYVSFTAEGRQLGEAALSGLSANAKATAMQVGRLALMPYEALTTGDGQLSSRHWQFSHAAGADAKLMMVDVAVAGEAEPKSLGAVSLLGALLGKLRATSAAAEGAAVSIALPPAVQGEAASAALADAAAIGGWKLVATPTASDALACALARKWPFSKADEGGASRLVLVLDMGATSTVASIVQITPPTGGELATEAQGKVVAEASDPFLGATLFDECASPHSLELAPGTQMPVVRLTRDAPSSSLSQGSL